MGSSKSVYTWHNADLPAPGGLFPQQQIEIPNLPTKGLVRRVRLVSATAGNRIQYWFANQDFTLQVGGLAPVPNGGQVSIISAQTSVTPQPVDHLGAELRDSNGNDIGTNQGVPFELIETGGPGSKTGSIFLVWDVTGTNEAFELQLVIEPLVT